MESRGSDEHGDDPATKRRKAMPNTSFIWKHFQRSEDKKSIACLHCLPIGATVFAYSGGTSTMTRHLRRKHGIFAPGKSEQDYERPAIASTVNGPPFASAMLTSFFDKSDDGGGNSTKLMGQLLANNLNARHPKVQCTRHTMQWIQYATTQYAPLHLDADLHALLRKCSGSFQPLQGPPLVAALMALMQGQRTALQEHLNEARPLVSLSVDVWPSATSCNVHVVTAHWITHDFQLRECVVDSKLVPIDADKSDLNQVIAWLRSTIDQWTLDVVAITVKPAWNTPTLARSFPNAVVVPCLVHQMNSVMQAVLSAFAPLLVKARGLVLAAPVNVVHLDHPAQWTSSLTMLQQPFVLNHALWKPEESQRLHDLVSILTPVHTLLQQVAASAHGATHDRQGPSPPVAPLAFALLHGVVKLLQDKRHAAHVMPTLEAILESPLLRRVCALDPRFKSLPFLPTTDRQDTLDKLQRAVASKSMPSSIPPPAPAPTEGQQSSAEAYPQSRGPQPPMTTPSSSSWSELYPFEDAQPPGDLQMYLDAPAAHDLVDPLAWWRVHLHVFPDLAHAARKYLPVSPCAGFADEALAPPDMIARKRAIPTGLVAAYMFVRSALRVPEIADTS